MQFALMTSLRKSVINFSWFCQEPEMMIHLLKSNFRLNLGNLTISVKIIDTKPEICEMSFSICSPRIGETGYKV